MKRLFFAFLIAVVAAPMYAGMVYDFSTVTTGQGSGKMAGRATVDGTNMRVDFTSGDKAFFKDNSVVISKDSGKTMILLDPKEKSYFEFSIEEMLSATGNMMKAMGGMFQMTVENQKVDVKDEGDGGAIEGYPTHKYIVRTSYDMSMKVMGMKSKSSVESVTEAWATDKIGREYITFVQDKGFKTGMGDLDKLIAAQAGAIKGFPLKQVVTQKTTSGNKTQTSTITTTVTGIKEAAVSGSSFEVPAGYKEADSPFAALAGAQN